MYFWGLTNSMNLEFNGRVVTRGPRNNLIYGSNRILNFWGEPNSFFFFLLHRANARVVGHICALLQWQRPRLMYKMFASVCRICTCEQRDYTWPYSSNFAIKQSTHSRNDYRYMATVGRLSSRTMRRHTKQSDHILRGQWNNYVWVCVCVAVNWSAMSDR